MTKEQSALIESAMSSLATARFLVENQFGELDDRGKHHDPFVVDLMSTIDQAEMGLCDVLYPEDASPKAKAAKKPAAKSKASKSTKGKK